MKKFILFLVSFIAVTGLFLLIHIIASGSKTVDIEPSVFVPKVITAETTSETKKPSVSETKRPVQSTTNETEKQTEQQTELQEDSATPLTDNFKAIIQYPELPTGCEITSLTMVLNYYGFDITKGDLSDNYLEKGEVGKVDFRMFFEGDPRDEGAFGCYAPVIVNAANKYLQSQNSQMRAREITDTDFEKLFAYTDNGIPVMTWCTYELAQGHFSVTWNVDGHDMTWYTPEHCMVLLGRNGDKAIAADPASGEVKEFDFELYKKRYEELFKQAVIIESEEET